MEQVIQIVAYLALLSVAAERFTEIVKRLWLSKVTSNGAVYQLTAACFGAFVAFIDPPMFTAFNLSVYLQTLLIALAISGGSGARNSILVTLQEFAKARKDA